MNKLKLLLGFIGVFIAFQFTDSSNMVNWYFTDKEYVKKINKFNNWKNKTVNKIKVNEAEYKNILKQLEEDEKNEEAFDFKKKVEKYNSTKEFTYEEIKEFKEDIEIYSTLNNWVSSIRMNLMKLVFFYLLYIAWLGWKPNKG